MLRDPSSFNTLDLRGPRSSHFARTGEQKGRCDGVLITSPSWLWVPHDVISVSQEVLLEEGAQLPGDELLILKGLLEVLVFLQQCGHLVLERIHGVHQAPAGQVVVQSIGGIIVRKPYRKHRYLYLLSRTMIGSNTDIFI